MRDSTDAITTLARGIEGLARTVGDVRLAQIAAKTQTLWVAITVFAIGISQAILVAAIVAVAVRAALLLR
jgi:hypothetical protein